MAGMRFRKLRIVWSVACGIACVLLMLLWVRSYWYGDYINYVSSPSGRINSVSSTYGTLRISFDKESFRHPGQVGGWHVFFSQWLDEPDTPEKENAQIRKLNSPQLHWVNRPTRLLVKVPHSLVAVLAAVAGAIPWWPKRFSLRALLITTMLVAVVMGLIVYAAGE
jgi:hypothetical protein